jgi:WD40 repeat protein
MFSLHVFQGHTASVSAAAFSPDGRWGVSSAPDRNMRLWELPK